MTLFDFVFGIIGGIVGIAAVYAVIRELRNTKPPRTK